LIAALGDAAIPITRPDLAAPGGERQGLCVIACHRSKFLAVDHLFPSTGAVEGCLSGTEHAGAREAGRQRRISEQDDSRFEAFSF